MIVFVNGQFVPEEQAVVSVFDRSFLYGDGLFETMRIFKGRPFRWQQHMERLQGGAEFLKIVTPFSSDALRAFAEQLISANQMPESLLRLTLSRGIGRRGYSPKGADRPSLIMSLHPAPDTSPSAPPCWRLKTASVRLPAGELLAQFKTCNKLAQVLARAEADLAGADEALLLNTDGHVVEASSSNLFWIEDNTVCTPPLASGILAGVTRVVVLEICASQGVAVRETNVAPDGLRQSQGIFLSLSSVGIAEGVSLDGHALAQSSLVQKLRTAYWDLAATESR
ncbi:MAG: branched-chain amino acid aminotransferase [Verrucomicrobiota bacterium]